MEPRISPDGLAYAFVVMCALTIAKVWNGLTVTDLWRFSIIVFVIFCVMYVRDRRRHSRGD